MVWDPEEKQKIKELAKQQGITQKEDVMNLVNEALADYEVEAKSGSMLEKMQKYIGEIGGPGDFSTNPEYVQGLGEDSLS